MSRPIMIRIDDSSGKQWLLNLQYVEIVQFPSTEPSISQNLNSEKVVMQGGEVLNLNPGTWDLALAELYAAFDDNPQPKENIKDRLYIMPHIP